MTSRHTALLIALFAAGRGSHLAYGAMAAHAQDAPPARAECREWQACRALAESAAARQDFEAFHDFAWRAVQTGPKNDPALMYLLARAQSASGRPGDALVMLQRLAAMGTPVDAATNEDFRRVRALPGWAALEAQLSNVPPKANAAAAAKDALKPEATAPAVSGVTRTSPSAESTSAKSTVTTPPSSASRTASAPESSATTPPPSANRKSPAASSRTPAAAADSLRFTTPQFTPAGLAYDAVSRRFIVGDRHARKLAVVDEFSQHVANLASAQATGFGEIAALEIDPQQGNLWVVTGESDQTTLHKLQLVSGRALGSYVLPDRFGAARFVDVAATVESAVIVLDASGRRLFRLTPKGQSLDVAATLSGTDPTSVAPAPEGIAYIADAAGITRVDFSSRANAPVTPAAGIDLRGITRLRWHHGSLIAVQRTDAGYRAVRIALGRGGRTATKIDELDAVPAADPRSATISGGALYYLASGSGAEMIVRRVALP